MGNYLRSPRTTQEKRFNQEKVIDDYRIRIRGSRNIRNLIDAWDDIRRLDSKDRCWKRYRRTQYKIKSLKLKKNSSSYSNSMAKRNHFHFDHKRCSYKKIRCKYCWKNNIWLEYDKQQEREKRRREKQQNLYDYNNSFYPKYNYCLKFDICFGYNYVGNYSQKVLDHFYNPRNVGTLNKKGVDVGHGIAGSAACGDILVFDIRVDKESQTIVDVKFKSFGCTANIASASYATELILGKTLNEAIKIDDQRIAEDLNLPAIKKHCSVLCSDAIKSAIEDYKKKQEKINV